MNNVRTVSDTKRSFYAHHTRPLNAIYRRVVEELMVEMHLLSVNADFVYDPIYALGVVTSFDRFMTGYQPESDVSSIFAAICNAVEGSAEQYRRDAEVIKAEVNGLSLETLKRQFQSAQTGGGTILQDTLRAIALRERFKYSRLFGIGLYTLVETVDSAVLEDKEKRDALLSELIEALNISSDKLLKDLELYRSNLEKMVQAQEVMKDMLEAERKKREQRAQAKQATAEATESTPAETSEPSENEAAGQS
ncbi:MAG: photosystem II biogenesis protein Psp29 [Leptolyngbya sp. SIO4C1]|nr:photosystem II biogenesis protein Psp29 [Leptolyngbya sp. SIO4C1]